MYTQNSNKSIPKKFVISSLLGIIILGLIFRYIFFPYDIPLILDSSGYFWYAIDTKLLLNFPSNHDLPNNLWPTILSIFFIFTDSDNFMDFMNIQRNLSIFFSVLTVIPIYFLAKKFFKQEIAIFAPLIFVLEPRIIANSLIGVTEPMYLFFVVSTLALFFSNNKNLVLSSFVLAGIFCLVRYEGLMMIFPMVFLIFYRYRKNKKKILYPIIAIIIFLIVITPMSLIKTETMGYDGIFSHVGKGAINTGQGNFLDNPENEKKKIFFELGFEKFFKLFGWILIPIFFIFMPLGLFSFFKKPCNSKWELVIIGIFAIIPALYAYSRGISDTRYLLVLYPILTIFSLGAIQWIESRWKFYINIKIFVIGFILIASFTFLYLQNDNEHQLEAYTIIKDNIKNIDIANDPYPLSVCFRTAILNFEDFPQQSDLITHTLLLKTDQYETIFDFLKSENGKTATHIIVDDSPSRSPFLIEIYENESKFPFLIKQYDSRDYDFTYHVKIFKIDKSKLSELELYN